MEINEWVMVSVIAVLGHLMALFWYWAKKRDWKLCERTIYDLPVKGSQLKRELWNSLQSPLHGVILGALLWFGFFENKSVLSFAATLSAIASFPAKPNRSKQRCVACKMPASLPNKCVTPDRSQNNVSGSSKT